MPDTGTLGRAVLWPTSLASGTALRWCAGHRHPQASCLPGSSWWWRSRCSCHLHLASRRHCHRSPHSAWELRGVFKQCRLPKVASWWVRGTQALRSFWVLESPLVQLRWQWWLWLLTQLCREARDYDFCLSEMISGVFSMAVWHQCRWWFQQGTS